MRMSTFAEGRAEEKKNANEGKTYAHLFFFVEVMPFSRPIGSPPRGSNYIMLSFTLDSLFISIARIFIKLFSV